jgi:cytochrome c oxidase subunit I+III
MRINLIPLYAWYILVVAGMILFAFPPLLAGDILFELERMADWPFFDPTRGGDPLLWQHLFWIFGHPEVYIIFLPSIALMAMIVPTFAQRPIFGYSWIVLAAVGTGFISFGLWVHHMFTTGLPAISQGFFSAASEAVVIPTGVQIFVFIATLLLGRVLPSTPMLFAAGALAIFVIGGLTGVMVALAPFDWQAHDSYFVVAHLHYVLIGGVLFPIVAGIYYYFPLVGDRKLSDRLGRWAFWLMFIGFNVGFLPMHLTGLRGMPRRVFTYPGELGLDWLNLVSTIGAFVFAAGVLVVTYDVLRPKRREATAERNPWNAGTLEWSSQIPPEAWGVRSIPVIKSRYPLWEQPGFVEKMDVGAFYLPDAEEEQRETIVTSTLDAEPIQCLRLAGPTWITIAAAIFTGGVFIFPTFHLYTLGAVSAVLALAAIVYWLWTGTAWIPEKQEKNVGLGLTLPLYLSGPRSCGWWAMFITMIGDATAYASLVFSYFFFWTIHDDFPPDPAAGPGLLWPTLGTLMLLAAWALTWAARRRHGTVGPAALRCALWLASACTIAGSVGLLLGPWLAGLNPTTHAYPATVWVLVGWTVLHGGVGLIMQLYCIASSFARRLTPEHDIDIWNVSLYWHFMGITALVTYAVTALFPLVA